MLKLLSKKQVEEFYREGYLIIPDVLTDEELIFCLDTFKKAFDTGLWKQSKFDSPYNINDIYRHFPQLIPIIFKSNTIDMIKDLLGEEIVCIPECTIHKNRNYDWHKDTTAMEAYGENIHLKTENILVKTAFYFQANTLNGGGLTLIPRTQKTKDRFVKMHYGNFFYRLYYRVLKFFNLSPFDLIEKRESPVNVANLAKDMILFNNQLDHRATFKRGKDGKAEESDITKFAIFNTFGKPDELARTYIENRKMLPNPYSIFLRQTSLPYELEVLSGKEGFVFFT